MIVWWLACLAVAAPLDVEVHPVAARPAPAESVPLYRPAVPVRRVASEVRVDGSFDDPEWRQAHLADPPRSLKHQAPPDPRWKVAVLATPGGLAIALRSLPANVRSDLAIDPDGSRRGWVRVSLEGGVATQADCRADPTDALGMPVRHKWNVNTWDCAAAAPALAAHGPAGWEVLVPWSSLEPATSGLRINWWAQTDGATATFDGPGIARDYAAAARPISVIDAPARTDTVSVRVDRTVGQTGLTLFSKGMEGPETWVWTASSNGQVLATGRVALAPNGNGVGLATVQAPIDDVDGVAFTTRRDSPEPLRPGAWVFPWYTQRRGSLATPVHGDHIEVRTWHKAPDAGVVVEVRDPDGTPLGTAEVDLPRGTARLLITRGLHWPEVVEVRVGDLFLETWLPTVHRGAR